MGGWLHPYLRRERSVLRVEAHQTMVGPAYAHSDSTSESEESTDLGDEISLGILLRRHDDAAFHNAAVGSTTGAWTDSPYLRLVPTTPPLRPPPLPQQRRRLRTPSRSPPRRARRMAPPPVPPLSFRPAPQTPPVRNRLGRSRTPPPLELPRAAPSSSQGVLETSFPHAVPKAVFMRHLRERQARQTTSPPQSRGRSPTPRPSRWV